MLRAGESFLRRLARRHGPQAPQPVFDAEQSGQPAVDRSRVLDRLAAVEAAALDIYAANGLPVLAGQYAKAPQGHRWTFIGADLSAQQRWSMVLEEGSTKGWRFRSLEQLGAEDEPEGSTLSRASEMLVACRRLRTTLATASPSLADDIEAALELGAWWEHRRASAADSVAEAKPGRKPKRRARTVKALP